ncbi:MAG TPA: hypothetical protein VFQ23_26275 [Anaerolineales bacterium]|nr:hypothetical protein [Anaerolineales bacterium]
MNFSTQRILKKPILFLLAVNVLIGLFVFRDYGLSWDEPLFYDYADALGYAYSPREWFSGNFDLNNSFGSSGDDHKTRGPAYLFLARGPAYLLEAFGLDSASAWHLVNFLFFQLGVYFLYRLSRRWMKPGAALAASALFSWQPLLWGHAFINPKDPPFLVFFLGSICLGFEMVDQLFADIKNRQKFISAIIPAILLGMTTSIRVLGPLAALLVFVYFVIRVMQEKKLRFPASQWLTFLAYGFIAIVTMFITWPYLWENPLARFFEVFRLMSDNPTTLSVLFGGEIYRAGELPRRYFPFMLLTTLTEPVWILFGVGLVAGYWKLVADPSPEKINKLTTITLTLFWFLFLLAYVLIRRPSMYDGIRHFLFILPPIFIFAGFTFEYLARLNASFWLRAGAAIVLLPGLISIIKLHPYEYTYYNSIVGGVSGAFRNYETDYWLTCYKESVEQLEALGEPINLFVHREAYIAEYYADAETSVRELRGALSDVQSGDYVLVNTRTNEDRRVFKDAPTVLQISRSGAEFCIIKRVP